MKKLSIVVSIIFWPTPSLRLSLTLSTHLSTSPLLLLPSVTVSPTHFSHFPFLSHVFLASSFTMLSLLQKDRERWCNVLESKHENNIENIPWVNCRKVYMCLYVVINFVIHILRFSCLLHAKGNQPLPFLLPSLPIFKLTVSTAMQLCEYELSAPIRCMTLTLVDTQLVACLLYSKSY